LLKENHWLAEGNATSEFRLITTGNPVLVEANLPLYLGYSHQVEGIKWQDRILS
jgi:hypothetical protein